MELADELKKAREAKAEAVEAVPLEFAQRVRIAELEAQTAEAEAKLALVAMDAKRKAYTEIVLEARSKYGLADGDRLDYATGKVIK